jgi:hypothetical protein
MESPREIDDRGLQGNPYDESKMRVELRAGEWVVLDALGNVIRATPTKAEAEHWLADLEVKGDRSSVDR